MKDWDDIKPWDIKIHDIDECPVKKECILEEFEVECIRMPRPDRSRLEGYNIGDTYICFRTKNGFHLTYKCSFYQAWFHMNFVKTFPKRYFRRIAG